LTDKLHPAAPHHLPSFITAPGETDVAMWAMGLFLIAAVLFVGNIFFQLHSLPERMAHKSQKLQFEIVAVLCLISLFTHIHLFWVIGLILALIDIPDFSTPLSSIAGSVRKIAKEPPEDAAEAAPAESGSHEHEEASTERSAPAHSPTHAKERVHA